MHSYKIVAGIPAAALTACLLLAGCGGSQPAATTSAATTTAAASTTAATTTAAAAPATEQAAPATTTAAPAAAAPTDSYIGDEAAKQAALTHAGIAAADTTELKCELDLDDPTVHYDVDFKAGGMEYDYDIDPTTGAVISFKSEVDD